MFLLPAGFSAAALNCGVKSPETTKLDLCALVSSVPASAAGVFTTNLVCGAPVKVSRSRLPRGTARGVVLNSGNSNACTGQQGIEDAQRMTREVAVSLGCTEDDILVCSTGVIGRLLPMDRILGAIPSVVQQLAPTPEAFLDVAHAMMTTDTVPKQAVRELEIAGKTVRISGVCKGAAMIAPNMATMLCVIMTDAGLGPAQAHAAVSAAVTNSFNCISVDGHESTSDSVILLANGASGATVKSPADEARFAAALADVAGDLARAIIHDAEGAYHFIEIDVTGAKTRSDAFQIAKSVANSPLVKTAIAGADPNWGRIVSAVGYAGIPMREQDISMELNGFPLFAAGTPLPFDAPAVSQSMRARREVSIAIHLVGGDASIRFWTSDLTKEYVELNADYTT